MPLTLRPTGLSSPAYSDQLDYTVYEDGRAIGRMYEDKQSLPERRWFWSITVYARYASNTTEGPLGTRGVSVISVTGS